MSVDRVDSTGKQRCKERQCCNGKGGIFHGGPRCDEEQLRYGLRGDQRGKAAKVEGGFHVGFVYGGILTGLWKL